jgi:hypothetical protein
VNRVRHLPSRDRLSVLTAVIVLAYALARFLNLPPRLVSAPFFGSDVSVELSGPGLMLLLVAALISTGSDTLIRSHPYFKEYPTKRSVPHWILPGATALVLGSALNHAPSGPGWWLGLGLSALALLAVLVAEYIVVDPEDIAWDAAALVLSALAYVLALILFALLRELNAPATISAMVGGLLAAGVAWRLFALKGAPLGRAALYAGLVGLISAEVIGIINYWRIMSIGAALMSIIAFYFSLGIAQQHLTGRLTRRVWIEYGAVSIIGLVIALIYVFL